MKYKASVRKMLDQICIALDLYCRCNQQASLLSGYFGCALFYAYYYRITGNNKHWNSMYSVVERAVADLSDMEMTASHCNGVAGIAWGMQHLVKHRFIEPAGWPDAIEEVDDLLFRVMKEQLEKKQYDFLHEGLGIALYFLEKLPDVKARACLEVVVSELDRSAISGAEGTCWKDNLSSRFAPGAYNLGLAHGIPAVLSVLCLLHEAGIAAGRAAPLIEQGVQWLLACRNESGTSLFPYTVTRNRRAAGSKLSRLGWCYGDLGIAVTLLHAARCLQNDRYKVQACHILEHTLRYRNARNGDVEDPFLCHGSMGISHIFRRACLATGNDLFLQGADKWLQLTFKLTGWNKASAGADCLAVEKFENNGSLLNGLAGVGLALAAALDPCPPAWDRCLLLS